MSQTITAQINFFGPYIREEDISKILDYKNQGTKYNLEVTLFEHFFDLF